MTAHQLIFTSCKRGILGLNDGQQVFSFDAAFPTNEIASLTSTMIYRGPDLPQGVRMSEALVPGYPKSFTYSLLGRRADLALTTYLGKDYMGPTGRFGNFLSHHVLVDDLPGYPAEFIGSPIFRTSMEYHEVNNPDQPEHLAVPEVVPGAQVSRDTVRAFLSEEGRWEQFTRMVACLLAGPATGKRIVIHDLQEHVPQWVGALGYVLPARCAAGVSFSTYEYDPIRGDWRIVGAIGERTGYDPSATKAYTFDLVASTLPDLDLPPALADFLEVGILIAPESIEEFHTYVEERFPTYGVADSSLYGAFALYRMTQGECEPLAVRPICEFLTEHGTEQQRYDTLNVMLGQSDGVALLTDPGARAVLLPFMNSLAHDGVGLLNVTFNAEGNLLDSPGADAVTAFVWANFQEQMVTAYPGQRVAVYRELVSYQRLDEALALFVDFLKRGSGTVPKAQFDEIISLLPSARSYPPFIDAYYAYATTPADRSHLLRFIMAQGVGFSFAGRLVAESLSEVQYGRLTDEQVTYIKRVWQWARKGGVDLRQCPRLWYLVCGLVLTSTTSTAQLEAKTQWVVDVAASSGLPPVTDDPGFVAWVVAHLVRVADAGVTLHRSLTRLGFRFSQPLVDTLLDAAFRRYDKRIWFKVAECVYEYGDGRLLDAFAQACKKLASRDLAALRQECEIRYARNPRAMRNWETVYAVTQSTPMRSVKALLGKRGEERGRTGR